MRGRWRVHLGPDPVRRRLPQVGRLALAPSSLSSQGFFLQGRFSGGFFTPSSGAALTPPTMAWT